jgi:hypothetical protein
MSHVTQSFRVLLLVLAGLATLLPAEAHAPDVVLSGFGAATIDGQLGPAEWDSAAKVDFLVNLPLSDGGGTTTGTLFVMNDGANLYLGVKVLRAQLNTGDLGFGLDQVVFEFDNDHNGGPPADGDDILLLSPGVNILGVSTFFDEARTSRLPCPAGLLCGLLDVQLNVPGTNDGAGAASNNGSFSFFEISHPLDSADDLNDFSLTPGFTAGFALQVNLSSVTPFCGSGCSASTFLPSSGGRGDVVIASAVLSVAIDVKPGSMPNSINPNSQGEIPVAILTTDTFDAATVDPTTVRFGRSGTEAAPVQSALADVDGDGDIDRILHVNTQETGIRCGDTSASLTGQSFGGQAVGGSDSVNIVGCRQEPFSAPLGWLTPASRQRESAVLWSFVKDDHRLTRSSRRPPRRDRGFC